MVIVENNRLNSASRVKNLDEAVCISFGALNKVLGAFLISPTISKLVENLDSWYGNQFYVFSSFQKSGWFFANNSPLQTNPYMYFVYSISSLLIIAIAVYEQTLFYLL